MKKILSTLCAALCFISSQAQDIQLPAPDMKQKSMSVVEALATRHSVREYSDRKLTNQELSNLCWAACGVSRDAQHRTAPTAMNRKEIRLFVVTGEASYEYLANENKLKFIVAGDNRNIVAGGSQAFVNDAPVSLVMVLDYDLFGGQNERTFTMGCVDAGNVSENINIYCQAVGLATVPRATMDVAGLRKVLNLTDKQVPLMNNPVGYPKK